MARSFFLTRFIKEAYTELTRVVWPTRSEVLRKTLLVIGCIVAGAVLIGLFDYGLAAGVKALLSFTS
ncbi:MAG: preprotein translocase subunit SecE [Patescibacteria group bacterium]